MSKKIAIACFGSWGDVAPMLALAEVLREKQGHHVRFLCPPESAGKVKAAGFEAHALGDSVKGQLSGSNMRSVRMNLRFVGFIRRQLGIQLATTEPLIKDCDLVLGSSFVWGVALVAEKLKIPYRFCTYCPQTFESYEHPPIVWMWRVKSRFFNRLLWRVFHIGQNFLSLRLINQWRKQNGLPTERSSQRVLHGSAPVLFCDPTWVSDRFRAERPDVLTLPRFSARSATEQALPEDLTTFLGGGGPLIYFGMGSMPSPNPKRVARNLADMAKKMGWRIVLDAGWAGYGGVNEENVFVTRGYLNHRLLFSKVDVVIHHGGAGTFHEAWYSGKPQVMVPHVLDQFYWAHCLEDRKRGVVLSYHDLGGKRMAQAIQECLAMPRVQQAQPEFHSPDLFLTSSAQSS